MCLPFLPNRPSYTFVLLKSLSLLSSPFPYLRWLLFRCSLGRLLENPSHCAARAHAFTWVVGMAFKEKKTGKKTQIHKPDMVRISFFLPSPLPSLYSLELPLIITLHTAAPPWSIGLPCLSPGVGVIMGGERLLMVVFSGRCRCDGFGWDEDINSRSASR